MANYGIQFKDKDGNKFYPCPFPIGFVVLTTSKVNPSTYWGGTWVQMYGGYLYAAQNSAGQTDYYGWGTQGYALTTSEMPSHSHTMYGNSNFGASSGAEGWYGINASVVTGWCYGNQVEINNGYGTYNSGGGQKHSHDIATVDVFAWKRTA